MASFPPAEALQQALRADIPSLVLSTATFGVFSHVSLFRSLPVEEYLYSLLGLYAATVVAVALAYLSLTDFPLLQVCLRVGCLASAFNTGLALSIAIYRLFFHRLRRFPGPWPSKLSRFYDAYLAGKNVQYNVEIAKMHEKYGDFFRTGPREICIVRKSAVPLLLSAQSKCGKSTFYAQAQTESKYCSVHHTRDFDDHRRRRKAWDRGFSIKALATYEPNIRAKADLLISHIEENGGRPIDATIWSMFLSFDIMGNVGFGKEFNNLSTGVEHPGIKAVHDHMAILGTMGHVPWLLNLISHLPGATSAMAEFFKWCEDEIVQKHKNWDINEHPRDVVSWLLKAYVEKDVSAAPTANALHEDSRAVLVAGSETTATTLASILYFLSKNPEVLVKLQRLLDEAMPGGSSEWAYDKIKDISYLDDIINETLRLRPAVMTGGYRVTPAEGMQVDEVYIPGDVNVFVPTQLIQTDERYYVDAKRFVPERWNEKKDMTHEGAPYFPFLYGPYVCPGKNLALMSLRISVSKLAQLYDINFAPGETGELFETKTLDTFTTTLPALHIQFVRR
ncbi:cytochrome P450 [Aspergillus aurantiobrunneus]